MFLKNEDILADPVGCVYDAVLHDHGRDADRMVCNLRASLACRDYASAFVIALALEGTRDRGPEDAGAVAGLGRFEQAAAMLKEISKSLAHQPNENGTLAP